MTNKPKRGGAREGAGPKFKPESEKRVTRSFRLSPQVARWLDSQDGNKSRMVENALIDKYNIK